MGVQKSRKHRGSCCSWRGEIVTSTLSKLKNPGWHFSLPNSRIPPYQLHVTADLQSGPIWVNVRRLNRATAASPPCTYVTSLLAGHSNSQGSRASQLPLLKPCRHTPAFTLVTDPRKKGFYCVSKENTAPYQTDSGRFLPLSLIWEALTLKVQISSHRNRMPKEERDSNTWNTYKWLNWIDEEVRKDNNRGITLSIPKNCSDCQYHIQQRKWLQCQ